MNAARTACLFASVLLSASGCHERAASESDCGHPEPAALDLDFARGVVKQGLVDCTPSEDVGYSGGNAFPITVVTVDNKPVEVETANAFWLMQEAAAADGVWINIVSGFRTNAEQTYLYGCYVNCNCNSCNLAAVPGYSNHQSGHALDLNTSTSGVLTWLNNNAATFGFSRTVPSEPWHWEWWGGGPGGGVCIDAPAACDDDPDWGGACAGSEISFCEEGTLHSGDCGDFGAACSTAGGAAHCVHFLCWTNLDGGEDGSFCTDDGELASCSLGTFAQTPCGPGRVCVEDETGAVCATPVSLDEPPEPSHDETEAADATGEVDADEVDAQGSPEPNAPEHDATAEDADPRVRAAQRPPAPAGCLQVASGGDAWLVGALCLGALCRRRRRRR
jgi:hypothetical protein